MIAVTYGSAFGQMIDTNFGVNGQAVILSAQGGTYAGFGLQVDPDGNTTVAGYHKPDGGWPARWFIYRCDAGGQPVISFGTNGITYMNPCNSDDQVIDMVVDALGRTIVTGFENWYPYGYVPNNQTVLGRLLPTGVADTTFGTTLGMSYFRIGTADTEPTAMAIAPDGRIALGGYTVQNSQNCFTVQLSGDGNLDSASVIHTHNEPNGWYLVMQGQGCGLQSGGLVLAGNSRPSITAPTPPYRLTLLKVGPDGSPDLSFGVGGWYQEEFINSSAYAVKVLEDPQGRLVVEGSNGTNRYLFRVLPDGTKDMTFGTNGETIIVGASGMDIAIDGRIVTASIPSSGGVSLTMYDANGHIINGFGINGTYVVPITGSGGIKRVKFTPDGSAIMVYGNLTMQVAIQFPVIRVLADISTGMRQENRRLGVYPNPTNGFISFAIDGITVAAVELFDISGRQVEGVHKLSGQQQFTLDLSTVMSGQYIARVRDDSGNQFWSIITKD